MLTETASAGEIVITVEGAFDAFAAWQLRGRLGALPVGANVVLDFARVHEFYDLGVAVMAHGLAIAERPHIRMRGLGEHEHKLFRYFGADLPALAQTQRSLGR